MTILEIKGNDERLKVGAHSITLMMVTVLRTWLVILNVILVGAGSVWKTKRKIPKTMKKKRKRKMRLRRHIRCDFRREVIATENEWNNFITTFDNNCAKGAIASMRTCNDGTIEM